MGPSPDSTPNDGCPPSPRYQDPSVSPPRRPRVHPTPPPPSPGVRGDSDRVRDGVGTDRYRATPAGRDTVRGRRFARFLFTWEYGNPCGVTGGSDFGDGRGVGGTARYAEEPWARGGEVPQWVDQARDVPGTAVRWGPPPTPTTTRVGSSHDVTTSGPVPRLSVSEPSSRTLTLGVRVCDDPGPLTPV